MPLTQIRKTIAKRLAASLGPIPHFFLTTEVDMERASEARDALNKQLGDQGSGKVSFNDIIINATAHTLTKHPACNAWFQEDHIRYWHEVHIGMAVAVEDGLITPVIRNAERKSLADIGREAKELAEKARSRRLQPSEYTGSTGRDHRRRLDRSEAGGGGRTTDAAAPHADHHELRPPSDRRRDGGSVPQDAQADAGEPAGDVTVNAEVGTRNAEHLRTVPRSHFHVPRWGRGTIGERV